MGEPALSLLRGEDPVVHRLGGGLAAPEVIGEQLGHLVRPARIERLERAADGAMGDPAAALEEGGVGHLVDEGVLEAIAGLRRAGRLVEELEPHQLAEGVVERVGLLPHRAQQAERDLPTDHGGDLEQPAGRVGEPVDSRAEHVLDEVRDRRARGHLAVIRRGPRELLEEERVALGLRQDSLGHRLVERPPPEYGAHHVTALVGRQERQRELGAVRAIRPARAISGPVGEYEQQPSPRRPLHQRRRVLLGERVDPVQIFHQDDERVAPAAAQRHLPQEGERAGLDRLRALAREGLGPLPHAEQMQHVGRARVGVDADLAQARAHLGHDGGRRVRLGDAAVLADDLEHRQIGHRLAVGRAVALEPRDAAAAQPAAELPQEAGLAHAGLSHHAHHLPAPGLRAREQFLQVLELALAADQRGERRPGGRVEARAARPQPEHAIRRHRLRPAAHRQRPHRLESHVALGEPGGGLAHENAARIRQLLESPRDIGGVADGGVVHAKVIADGAHHHETGVDPHPDGQRGSAGGGELAHPALNVQRGQHGPAGMVLTGHRRAEERHEAVAEELIHRPAVAMNLGEGQLEEALEEGMHGLRAQPLGEHRRPGEIAEEHGDLLPLAFHRAPRGQDAVGQVRRRIGLGIGHPRVHRSTPAARARASRRVRRSSSVMVRAPPCRLSSGRLTMGRTRMRSARPLRTARSA